MTVGKDIEPNWTEAEDRRLMICWNRGESIGAIALQIDRTKSAIKKRRAVLGLPKRKGVHLTDHQLRTNVDQATYDALNKRAFDKGTTVANYIRLLIKRDLGM